MEATATVLIVHRQRWSTGEVFVVAIAEIHADGVHAGEIDQGRSRHLGFGPRHEQRQSAHDDDPDGGMPARHQRAQQGGRREQHDDHGDVPIGRFRRAMPQVGQVLPCQGRRRLARRKRSVRTEPLDQREEKGHRDVRRDHVRQLAAEKPRPAAATQRDTEENAGDQREIDRAVVKQDFVENPDPYPRGERIVPIDVERQDPGNHVDHDDVHDGEAAKSVQVTDPGGDSRRPRPRTVQCPGICALSRLSIRGRRRSLGEPSRRRRRPMVRGRFPP